MDYQWILFIIMQTIYWSYVTTIWTKYGIQKSISNSYYCLPTNWNFLFTLFCWGFAFLAIILGESGLMFLAGTGIAFVGAAAQIKEKFVRQVHLPAAIIGMLASQADIYFNQHLLWLNLISIGLSIFAVILSRKNYIWWVENIVFIAITISYLITKLHVL
jgi:hypothetical protein